ncbi:beta-lactamase, putative [Verrucomicrobiia bacterium DG1235]|nr:beta-lactamase, putative [Verrucomicrobiae bacterium DG1235]
MFNRLILPGCYLFYFISIFASASLADSMLRPDLRSEANSWHAAHQQPNEGVSMGEVNVDKRVYSSAGKMRQGGSDVDEQTLYEIGSITKVFTGILLADTVLQGKAKLEDPVGMFLPESVVSEDSPLNSVTLFQLATHTSGLPLYASNLAEDCENCSIGDQYANYSRERLYSYLKNLKQEDLGEVRSPVYSNIGFEILGEVLAIVNGTDYSSLLYTRILSPLGMGSTWAKVDENSGRDSLRSRMASGHRAGESVPSWNWHVLAGGGSIVSSVEDMLTFAEAHWSESTPDHLKEAFALAKKEHANGIGLAWRVVDGMLIHFGQTGGFFAKLQLYPQEKYGLVSLANSAEQRVELTREGDFSSVVGLWFGNLDFGGSPFPLAMHVLSDGSANVFVIKQGGTLLPSSRTSFDQESGRFVADYPGIKGRYEAKLESDGKLRGLWKFNGDRPLEMELSEELPGALRVLFETIYPDDISPLEGFWSGTVEGSDGSFKCIEVAPLADQFQMKIWGTMDNSLPAGPAKVLFDAEKGYGELRFEVIHFDAVFEGSLDQEKKTIKGIWTHGESNPLTLTWTKDRPEGI